MKSEFDTKIGEADVKTSNSLQRSNRERVQ